MQDAHLPIHHSIGAKPDHQMFNSASVRFREAAAELWDVAKAPAEIDRVIRECYLKSAPVYIFMPLDMSGELVERSLLDTPIDTAPKVDEAAQKEAVDAVLEALKQAKRPAVVVDAWTQRFGAEKEAAALVKRLGTPFFSTSMGKGVVDETDEWYVGVWNGEVSRPGVKECAKAADLVITLGYIPADTNSGGFTRRLDDSKTIHINPHSVVVNSKTYANTSIKSFIAALTAALPTTKLQTVSMPQLPPPREVLDKDAKHITQSFLWPTVESFLRENDTIISETGTSNFGLYDVKFPAHTQFVTQIYYGSIGFATAATLGADVARRETKRGGRTLLFTGDGSFALTMQEVGTMIKAQSPAVLFILNNEGYTIERFIWGARQPYNDIVASDYAHLLPFYKHPKPQESFHRATTKEELVEVLGREQLQNPTCLQVVEIVVPKMDGAWMLGSVLARRSEDQKKYLTDSGFVDPYGNWSVDT